MTGVPEIVVLFAISIIGLSAFLEHEPIHDEFYHLLAARSWADSHLVDGRAYTPTPDDREVSH